MSIIKDFRADLHCHTTCSDGTTSPEEIVRMAASIGLSGLSITDHDTIEAYTTALPEAKKLGIQMIPGVEFSSFLDGVSVHILAYAFSLDNSLIKDFCLQHTQRRTDRNREMLHLLAKHQMPITEEELLADHPSQSIGRPHIALAMIKKGYVESITEAFNKFIGDGKSCYVPGRTFSTEETVELIHQAKGLAVIAHPHLITHTSTLKKLLKIPFDGIECYYARFHLAAVQRWLKIADHHHLLITGGSDYHGSIKPTIPLGASWVNEERFQPLLQHYESL